MLTELAYLQRCFHKVKKLQTNLSVLQVLKFSRFIGLPSNGNLLTIIFTTYLLFPSKYDLFTIKHNTSDKQVLGFLNPFSSLNQGPPNLPQTRPHSGR